jgi:CubicO group peptidase (beta-lactamase class C family)
MKRLKKMVLYILLIVCILGIGLSALAPHVPTPPKHVENIAELETYFNRLVDSGTPPSLSVAVVKDGEVVYQNAFGYADAPRGIKATPDTVYHWWSMTKIPTAIAIMQLQEQGKLNLDDEVTTYLPWFEVKGTFTEPIRIRHLLQHSSGLPDTMPAMIGWVHYDDEPRNQTELAKKFLPDFNTLKFEPGTQAAYSNFNYMLLGAVIEAVTRQPYETYITENILGPLGMSHTDFVYTASMVENEAVGTLPLVHFYTPLLPGLLDIKQLFRERDGKILWMNRIYIDATPPTGLIGSAPDVARLMNGYLSRFSSNGQQILPPESVAMLTNTAPLDERGLGWFIGESNGRRFVDHAGGGPGFATIMRLYTDSNLGIVILSNGTDLDRDALVELLAGLDWKK